MKDYQEILKGYQPQIIETLKELISIKSVVSEAEGNMPFGKGVDDAFSYMLDKSRYLGFRTFDADRFGGHAEMGEGEECMGILAILTLFRKAKAGHMILLEQ